MNPADTPAQTAAEIRNHRIRMLRGLYANAASYLDTDQQLAVFNAIDVQLTRYGAQQETVRRRQNHAALLEGKGYYKGYGKRRKFVEYKT